MRPVAIIVLAALGFVVFLILMLGEVMNEHHNTGHDSKPAPVLVTKEDLQRSNRTTDGVEHFCIYLSGGTTGEYRCNDGLIIDIQANIGGKFTIRMLRVVQAEVQ